MTTTITVQTASHAVKQTTVENEEEVETTIPASSTVTVYIHSGKSVAFEEISETPTDDAEDENDA